MARTKYLSTHEKQQIVNAVRRVATQRAVADQSGVSVGVVNKWVSRMDADGNVHRLPNSGRPRKYTANDAWRIILAVTVDPTRTSKSLAVDTGLAVSPPTARRMLKRAKEPCISMANRKKRLAWAKQRVDWTPQMCAVSCDSIQFVRRPPNTRYESKHTAPTKKFSGGNIMVWGCFSRDGLGPLVRIEDRMNAQDYRRILEESMLEHAPDVMPINWRFQQDNDPKHTSRLLREWFENQGVDVLEWPAQSLDLNPIDTFLEAWDQVTMNRCAELVGTMQRRCLDVIRANGMATKW